MELKSFFIVGFALFDSELNWMFMMRQINETYVADDKSLTFMVSDKGPYFKLCQYLPNVCIVEIKNSMTKLK